MAVSIAEMIYIAIELSDDYSLHANFVSLNIENKINHFFRNYDYVNAHHYRMLLRNITKDTGHKG